MLRTQDPRSAGILAKAALLALSATALATSLAPDEAAAFSAACIALNSRTDTIPHRSKINISGFEPGDVITVMAQYTGTSTPSPSIQARFNTGSGSTPFFDEDNFAFNESRTSGPQTNTSGASLLINTSRIKSGGTTTFLLSYQCGTPAEPTSLDDQQDSFTPLGMNQTAQGLSDGVSGNVNGRFNGGGVMTLSPTSFYVQSSGMQQWLSDRRRDIAREQRDLVMNADEARTVITPAADTDPVTVRGIGPLFNFWLRGEVNYFDGDGSSFDGLTADIMAGADYKITDSFLIGVLGGYNNADFDISLAGVSGDFNAEGFSVGPYIGVQISEHLVFDALFAYTRSDYDNRSGVTTGDFDADRYTFAANLTGKWEHGNYIFEPSVGFTYATEKQESYVDSAATAHSSTTIEAGRLTAGPRVGRTIHVDRGTLTPWFAGYFVYDFSNRGNAPGSGLPDLGDVASARVSTGIDAALQGFNLAIESNITGLGSGEYVSYGGSARIDVPF